MLSHGSVTHDGYQKLKVDSIDATAFGPNCPQHDTSILSVYEADARQFLIPLKSTSEDCLFANI